MLWSQRTKTGWAALLLIAAGCSMQDGSSTTPALERAGGDFSGRRLPQVDPAEVRAAAERVFRSDFRVDPALSSEDTWVSRPAEVDHPRGERLRDVLSVTPSRHRQIAELRLIPDGDGVLLRCRIRTQRQDTAERTAFARETGDDRPANMPIERPETSSRRQEEWTTVGRDRQGEQNILNAIQQAFAPVR